jgi:pimeloyl-ACP methyl ester carboxylesterase
MKARVRHVLVMTAVVVVVILLAGATYQGVATALERRKYQRPGGLVEVGDHQLHIHCSGAGSPTVVLEASASGISASWGWIQPEVAKHTRVCSYDRSGLGWSETGDRPFDPRLVPEELRGLLKAADVPGPYVLAGHSLGASFVRMYSARYPDDVAALVLVDPPSGAAPRDERFLTLWPWLARAGVLRASRLLSHDADGLPEPAAGAVRAFLNRPDHLTRASREMARWDDAVRLGAEVPTPKHIPVAEVTLDGEDRQDGLNERAAAQRVSEAILHMVRRVHK